MASNGNPGLIPATTGMFVGTLGQRALRQTGITLSNETKVAIDPASGKAIPISSRLDVPPDAIERLAAIAPTAQPDDRLAVTKLVKIDTVFSVGVHDEPLAPVSTATQVSRLGTHVLNLHQFGSPGLEALVHMVGGATSYEVRSSNAKNMLTAITEGMRADAAA